MVSSLDGKITKGDSSNIYEWTSPEDQNYFADLIKSNNLIVMGSATFDAVKPKPQKNKLRIVLTRSPQKYSEFAVSGQLEFTSETPPELVNRLDKQYQHMLLVGGGKINTLFFKAGLVDELWLTLEPKILGKGKNIISENDLDIRLQLVESKNLNDQGTLLLKYKVLQ